jgi:hypothetical protein
LKGGKELVTSDRVKSYEEAEDSYTLVIKHYIDIVKAETSDGDTYTLVVENEHGKMEQSFQLHVNRECLAEPA